MREIGPVAKSFEERPHIPQQRISIRIAVADPILRSAGEARAAAGIGNIPVSSAWKHRSIAQIGLRKLVMNRKMSTDLVHENEFRTMIGKFTYEFPRPRQIALFHGHVVELHEVIEQRTSLGRASCRERVCQYV